MHEWVGEEYVVFNVPIPTQSVLKFSLKLMINIEYVIFTMIY